MLRRALLLATTLFLLFGTACGQSRRGSELKDVAQQLFAAAAVKDSTTLLAMTSNRLVVRDMQLVDSVAPGLAAEAARGLTLDRASEFAIDSVYLYVHPSVKGPGGENHAIDLGLTRQGGTWRVYYVGLTGKDLIEGDQRQRQK
jgi:hypothetical protein